MPATPAVIRRNKFARPGHDGHGYSDFRSNEFPGSSDESDTEKSILTPLKQTSRTSHHSDNSSRRHDKVKPDRLVVMAVVNNNHDQLAAHQVYNLITYDNCVLKIEFTV